MVYYIIACSKEKQPENKVESLINNSVLKENNRSLGNCFPLTESVVKKQFKVGSLDQLMELMDVFAKYELQIDNSCKRNEKMYFDMCKELQKQANLKMEVPSGRRGQMETIDVEKYIQNFKWDHINYQMDKSLKVLGAKIANVQKMADDRLKKILDELTQVNTKLGQLTKKDSPNFMVKDLGDIVYEQNIGKGMFVNTHGSEIMTTILVVVGKKKVDQFKQNYTTMLINFNQSDFENWQKRTRAMILSNNTINDKKQQELIVEEEFQFQLKEHQKLMNMPGVVPGSDKFLGKTDPDGNQLWRVTCMKDQATDFVRVLKKNGFQASMFDYDIEKYTENQRLLSQLKVELTNYNLKIMNMCYFNFQQLFSGLLHLKIMRTFIDGVLRFGIPPTFFMGVIKPAKNADQKIMAKLTDIFAEEHLKDMYGQKEDAQDEDFFPYVSNTLSSPSFLM